MSVAKGFRLSDDSTAKLDWNYVTKPDGTKSIIEEVNDVKQDLAEITGLSTIKINTLINFCKNVAMKTDDTWHLEALISAWTSEEPIHATGITIDSTMSVDAVTTKALNVTVTPSNTTDTVTFTSSDPTIATVDSYGNVTGTDKLGTATITATVNGHSDTCTVTNAYLPV